jgi:hypothetical protein
MSETFGESMNALQTNTGTTQEEAQQIKAGILAIASPRDIQFAGFAQLLFEELKQYSYNDAMSPRPEIGVPWNDRMKQQIIAQRAYDLACHILSEVFSFSHPECVLGSPCLDMTEWPEETK